MEYLIQTEADRAAITELPITAIKTHRRLQIRNVGSQKYRDDNDTKRYAGHVKDIAEDIQRQGQLVAVKVVIVDKTDNPTTEQFWLVDGHHRLEAIGRLQRQTIKVEVVGGRGFREALIQSRLSNNEIMQPLSRLERIENVWTALNLPSDCFRAMSVNELAKTLSTSPSTIKRMRQSIRKQAEKAGAIDPTLPKAERQAQLLAYWNKESVWSHYSNIPWYIHNKGQEENEKNQPDRVEMLKKKLVQTALGEKGLFDMKTIQKALEELAEESKKGSKHLEKRYKPTITQSFAYAGDDEYDEYGYEPKPALMEEPEGDF